jgi:hypothetical protein
MADYNQQSGFQGQEGRQPVSTYTAAQDEFGFKEGNDYPTGQQGSGQGQGYGQGQGQGYGDQGYGQGQGYGGDRTGETFQDAPDRITGYGDTDTGVGGE